MLSWLRKVLGGKPEKNEPAKDNDAKQLPDGLDGTSSTHAALHNLRSMRAARKQFIAANAIPVKPEAFRVVSGSGMDAAAIDAFAMDDGLKSAYNFSGTMIPDGIFSWYISQGFIGWQACAILAQQWLIAKACYIPGKDAAQGGWKITVNDGKTITPEQIQKIREIDTKYKVIPNLIEAHHFRQVFGIRHVLFLFDGMDYEKPFNPDGIRKGSYRGMTQVDPYWMAPFLDASAVNDPKSQDFYEPTYWQISGKKYHKSHFVILRGPDVADILKPSYFYGGVPLTQRIYERVYAAERTANEAPQLAMTKRLTVRYTDLAKALANQQEFELALQYGTEMADNFGVMAADTDEKVERHETSLADLDDVQMTQYQLVAAIAEMPSTKLLGTSPKGFGASGDYEIQNYHEHLSGIQENDFRRILDRHYQAVLKSEGVGVDYVHVVFNPLKQMNAKEIADLNKAKADTDTALQAAGAIDGYDIRARIAADENSGYNGIEMPSPEEMEAAEQENSEITEAEGETDGAKVPDEKAE